MIGVFFLAVGAEAISKGQHTVFILIQLGDDGDDTNPPPPPRNINSDK